MAPSQLQIATSSLQRFLKEEASYHKEQEQQEARIAKLEKEGSGGDDEGEDGNQEFRLKQEKRALEETKAIIPTLRERITSTREKLESYLDTATNDEERNKAVEVLKAAKEAQKDDPIAGQKTSG
ncbi:tubulin binding cofactor A [Capronia coronata CBS 617.96]|uniref:Tubulin-specific chaperone A n=1 Tax=Capronia coronata CBS 617.96 TaxID=1182541 RepID=W9Z2E8_9EURO|nr:tubulin binding cofactor A [Capronia coronata CBS 617.96]EXJ88689.1 tubulin binding cofactor A [Capronia coronata CBS 617.96]